MLNRKKPGVPPHCLGALAHKQAALAGAGTLDYLGYLQLYRSVPASSTYTTKWSLVQFGLCGTGQTRSARTVSISRMHMYICGRSLGH